MGLKPQAQGSTKHSRPGSLVSSELFCTLHSVPAHRARLGARALGLDAKCTPSTHSHVLAHEHMCTGTLSDTHTRSKLGAQTLTPREHSQLLKHRSSTSTRHTHWCAHTRKRHSRHTHGPTEKNPHTATSMQPPTCRHTHTRATTPVLSHPHTAKALEHTHALPNPE